MNVNLVLFLSLVVFGCDAPLETIESDLCHEADAHMLACTGVVSDGLGAGCDVNDAQMVLDTPCEVLATAATYKVGLKADGGKQPPFLCRFFNIGCPPEDACLEDLPFETWAALVTLSDPETLVDPFDARVRVETISQLFREAGDPRGLFATVYRLITNRAVESVEAGDYEHPEWAHNLITEFARRYLANLHGHLTQGEVTGPWTKYYDLAQNCNVGRGRTLGVAIAVHLMMDLPYVLHGIGSMPEQRDDFVLFGDILLQIFPQLIIDVQADYDTDVTGLLQGFFLGDWVDAVGGEGTMTNFIYQGVRLKAWRDSQNMRNFPMFVVESEMNLAWGLAEVFLAKLDADGAL